MTMLATLPTEIHSIIISFASAARHFDDERVDHSSLALCLTSRHFLSLAQPILYQAPFLAGRRRTCRFAQTLRDCPRLAKHVIHLAISDVVQYSKEHHTEDATAEEDGNSDVGSSLEILPAFAFARPATRQGRLDRLHMLDQWMDTRAKAINAFRSAFLQVLAQTSPQLRSLAILFYSIYNRDSDSGLADALSLTYPQLTELTIREDLLSFSWPPLSMPSLRSLRIAGGNPPYPQGLFEALSGGCPQLVHLRLSEPFIDEKSAVGLKNSFLRVEDSRTTHTREGDHALLCCSRYMQSLETIFLQPCLLQTTGPQTLDIMECLNEIAEGVEAFEIGQPSDRSSNRYPFVEAVSDWTSRLGGIPVVSDPVELVISPES